VIVLASGTNAVVLVSRALAAERGVDADQIRAAFSGEFGGGGGGRATLARAGGGDPGRIDAALDAAQAALEGIIG
jgi:alanyl-tRNA synthetase